MKAILLILTTLMLLPCITRSQQSYNAYHDSINMAEKYAFIDSNYSLALQKYKQVFRQYDFCFSRDYICAAQLAMYAKDFPTALYIIKQSFKNGLTVEDYKCLSLFAPGGRRRVTIFDSLLKNKKVVNELSRAFADGRKQYKNRVNIPLKRQVNQVYIEDQISKNNPGRTDGSFDTKYHFSEQKYEPFYDSTIHKYGYPGEKLIGIDDSDAMTRLGLPQEEVLLYFDKFLSDSSKYLHIKRTQFGFDKEFSPHTSIIPLLHNTCAYQFLEPYLSAQIDSGNLHPREAAMVLDFAIDRKRSVPCLYNKVKYFVVEKMMSGAIKADIDKTNEQRKQLHMPPIEQDIAKGQFSWSNNLMLFMGFFYFL